MILYLTLIGIAVLGIATGVSLGAGANFFSVLGMTLLATVIVIALDGFTAAVCRLLPEKWIKPKGKIYFVSAKEKKFYEKLKIRKWKDKIPEIGHFTGFRKNKLLEPKSVEYLDRFLLEIYWGELGHFFSLFTSYLLLLFFPIYSLWLPIAIPVATVSFLLNIPSLMVLRYTSYKLRILRASVAKRQKSE